MNIPLLSAPVAWGYKFSSWTACTRSEGPGERAMASAIGSTISIRGHDVEILFIPPSAQLSIELKLTNIHSHFQQLH